MPQSNAPTREQVLAFLIGAGEIDGCGFGDRHPTLPGAFWWRRYLPALSQPSPAVPTREALINAIKRMHGAKGRYHTQHAACDLYDLLGLACTREANAAPQPTEPAQPTTQAGAVKQGEIDLMSNAEITKLLRGLQTRWPSRPGRDEPEDRETWDRIDAACAALAQSADELTDEQAHRLSWRGNTISHIYERKDVFAAEIGRLRSTFSSDAPQQGAPLGWKLSRLETGAITVNGPIGRCVVQETATEQRAIPEELLHALASALIESATQQPQPAEQGEDAARLDWPTEATDIADAIDSYTHSGTPPDMDNIRSWSGHLRRLIAEDAAARAAQGQKGQTQAEPSGDAA